MMGTVCRVLMRQIPQTCYKMGTGFPCVYPIHLPNAACISSSCINLRRMNYSRTGKLDVDQVEEDEDYGIPEPRHTRHSSKNVWVREQSEYISDDESSDDVTDDKNVGFSFIKLPRRGQAARLEMNQCSMGFLKTHGLYLVKTVSQVQRILDSGILPKKIFFTRTSDLTRLKSDLRGVKLFKIQECDVLYAMQRKAEPPFFAVCDRDAPPPETFDAPANESIPLVIGYATIRSSGTLNAVLQAATMCGCRKLLFKQSFDSLFNDTFYSRHNGMALRKIPAKFLQDWDMIQRNCDPDASYYLMTLSTGTDSNHGLPIVNLHEIDFWKSKEVVLILAYSITDKELQFCHSKKAQLITVNGANEGVHLGVAAVGAVTFEIWRQWNARSKPKTKTKVNKRI